MRALRRRRPSVIRPWPARLRSVRAWRRARHAGTPALARAGDSVVQGWRTAIDHRLVNPDDSLFTSQYARWTRQNKRNRTGRYRFVLAAAWDTRTLADGLYVVEVSASDVSGNTTVARFPIRIANRTARV